MGHRCFVGLHSWDRQLVFGLTIDIALVTVALWQRAWLQNLLQHTFDA